LNKLAAFAALFSPLKGPAWQAWQRGDFERAAELAREDKRAGPRLLLLLAHITGDYDLAVREYAKLSAIEKNTELVLEAVFESLLHLGRATEALEMFAPLAKIRAYRSYYLRAQFMANQPMTVDITSTCELPFVKSEITDLFPGISGRLNGQDTTIRFDTGGAYLQMSPSLAARFGVKAQGDVKMFADLKMDAASMGVLEEMVIGTARLTNVPVIILDMLDKSALTEIDRSPIMGTNVLQQFLTTIDTPNQRFILSRRGDYAAHFARLSGRQAKVPFVLWGSHFMIARGALDGVEMSFFIDNGLIMESAEFGQPSLLVPKSLGSGWAATDTEHMRRLPGMLRLGTLEQANATAMVTSDAKWRPIAGSMGGVRVGALLSYGFLKHRAWTLDFDRREYVFHSG